MISSRHPAHQTSCPTQSAKSKLQCGVFASARFPHGEVQYGGSTPRLSKEQYLKNIDNAVTMTDQVATSNGVTHEKALSQVEKDESYYFLPTHRKLIIEESKRP